MPKVIKSDTEIDRLSFFNAFHHLDRVKEVLEKGDTWPVHVLIGTVNYCNHGCLWCTAAHYHDKTRLGNDIEPLMDMLAQMYETGAKALSFMGPGEPTLHPKWAKMVKGANEIGYDVGMLTNGERISPKDIPMIVDHMMWLRFTFNAPSAATYKLIHDVDEKHFERVKQNIQDIVKAKGSNELPTIGMQMVFDNHNFDEIADGAKLAKEFGVDYYEVKPRLHWNNFGENFTENGLLKLQDELAEIEEGNFPIYIKWNQILPSLKQKSTVKYLKKTYPVCLGHSWNVKITPSGGVEECLHMEPSDYLDEDERELRSSGVGKSRLGANSDYMSKKYIVGNIYSGETFREMWTSEARGKALQELDLANCPVLCRLNPLNEILWQLKVPEKENHISFL